MNSSEAANRWTSFLAGRSEIPRRDLILKHFRAGAITRLCECGCNSYDIAIPKDLSLEPLLKPKGRGGCILSIAFRMRNRPGSVEFDIFADASGYLAGIDVACNGNSEPVPDELELEEPPYQIDGAMLRTA